MGEIIELCKEDEVAEGRARGFVVHGKRILVARVGGTLYAVDGTCTHAEADLSTGFLVGERITCPLHLSIFDLETGKAISPPATEPLRTFEVEVVDGNVCVRL